MELMGEKMLDGERLLAGFPAGWSARWADNRMVR